MERWRRPRAAATLDEPVEVGRFVATAPRSATWRPTRLDEEIVDQLDEEIAVHWMRWVVYRAARVSEW